MEMNLFVTDKTGHRYLGKKFDIIDDLIDFIYYLFLTCPMKLSVSVDEIIKGIKLEDYRDILVKEHPYNYFTIKTVEDNWYNDIHIPIKLLVNAVDIKKELSVLIEKEMLASSERREWRNQNPIK
jgi:hypothetical protein